MHEKEKELQELIDDQRWRRTLRKSTEQIRDEATLRNFTEWSISSVRMWSCIVCMAVSALVLIIVGAFSIGSNHGVSLLLFVGGILLIPVPMLIIRVLALDTTVRECIRLREELEDLKANMRTVQPTSAGDSSTRAARVSEPPEK